MSMKDEIARELTRRTQLADPDMEATPKQIDYLAFLLRQDRRPRTDEDLRRIFDTLPDAPFTRQLASEMIDELA